MDVITRKADGTPHGSADGSEAVNMVISDKDASNTRHNRYLDLGVTANVWPGDDTFSVAWLEAHGITRYRVLAYGGADGDYVKVTEDAINETVEEAALGDPTSSRTVDVNHIRVYTSTPDINGSFIPLWSEWQVFPEGSALQRLGFLASSAGCRYIFVEAQ